MQLCELTCPHFCRWKCSARSWDVCMFCFSRYCWFSKVAVSASVPASGTWVSQCSAGSSALGTQSSFQLFCWVVVRSRCGFSCHFPLLNWKVWKLSRCLAEFRYLLLQSAYWRLLLIFKWDYLYFFFFFIQYVEFVWRVWYKYFQLIWTGVLVNI